MTQSRIIDLLGPDGNAYALMALASKLAKQLSLDGNKIIEEMKSGDYKNLLNVFSKYFWEYVELQNVEIATGELKREETILPNEYE
jgi:hypothetical protein